MLNHLPVTVQLDNTDNLPLTVQLDNTDNLPPVRRIRSALIQRGLGNKIKTLLVDQNLHSTDASGKTTRVITPIVSFAILQAIVGKSHTTLIHESALPNQDALRILQQYGYKVQALAGSWNETLTFKIHR
ncbi:hypothetical protein K2X92_02035 [Candidatus Gracilibacteria bacterium]|nr:hypothetical protein [Candidatus Gracilibacteria bacterium]